MSELNINQNSKIYVSAFSDIFIIKLVGKSYLCMDMLFGGVADFMHQSFASPAPPGPWNSGSFNFSIFKARLKAPHCRARFVVKPLLKAPAPRELTPGELTITWNNSWEMKLKHGRRASIYACECLGVL